MLLATNDEDWEFVLLNLYNDLLGSGNVVIQFCDDHVQSYFSGYDKFELLLCQNSNALMPGQTLELKACIGAFSSAVKLRVFVNGAALETTDMGYAKYKRVIKPNDPEKINLRVEYKDQNGMETTRQQLITYKVLKP